jgi:hypothetical protein
MLPDPQLRSRNRSSGGSQSSSSSISYDHSGADLAHKHQDEAHSLSGSHAAAMMDDPLSAMPISKRINHLQNYLRAFGTGYNPHGLNVLPAARVASASGSSSSSSNSSDAVDFHFPENPYSMRDGGPAERGNRR